MLRNEQDAPTGAGGGQGRSDARATDAPAEDTAPAVGGQEGQTIGATHAHCADLSALVSEIRDWHRQRMFAMEQRKRLDLSVLAFVRTAMGFSTSLPAADRKQIGDRANAIVNACEAQWRKEYLDGLKATGEISEAQHRQRSKSLDTTCDDPLYHVMAAPVFATLQAREAFDRIEADATAELERLGKELPIWPEFRDVPGIRGQTLATIVGEAGDIGAYGNPAKLWKRMGVGLVGDRRQGAPGPNAGKQDWIEHGYNAARRSRMWNIGQALVKTTNSPYRQVYLDRKAVELEKAAAEGLTVKPAAEIKKAEQDRCRSVGHIANRAQRYMEKRLLRDVWQAWRRTKGEAQSIEPVSAAD